MKQFIVTVIFVLIFTGLQAQDEMDQLLEGGQEITLQSLGEDAFGFRECVEYALEHNISVSNAGLQVERQYLNYKGALHNYLPTVGAGANYSLSRGRAEDPNTSAIIESEFFSGSYSINSSLNLFNGFRQHQQVGAARLMLKASGEKATQLKNELALTILEAYVQHLANTGFVAIGKEQVQLSKTELKRVQKMIQLGLSSGSDLYEAEAALAAEEYQLILYQNKLKSSENELKRLMNFPSDMRLSIKPLVYPNDKGVLREYNVAEIYEAGLDHLPQLQALHFRLKAAQKQVNMHWSGMVPSVRAFAGVGSGYYETSRDENNQVVPLREQLRINRGVYYGLSMNIPLFNGFRQHNALQQARIDKKEMENQLKSELQLLEYDVQQTVLDRNGAAAAYQAVLKQKESMATAFEVIDKKREKGMISMTELALARNRLAEARTELLRTELQVFLSEQTIRFYLTGSLF